MRISTRKGFTLIEIAIVLVIIGLIIGAAMKGKDLIRSAEQKKVYSKFLNQWSLSYMNFYDRTGMILGDTYDGSGVGQDGKADTGAGGSASPTDAGRDDLIDGGAGDPPPYYGLDQLGLVTPVTNTDEAWRYLYTDGAGVSHELEISFAFDDYNYMMIENIPNELAMAVDRMVDGKADGTAGDFIGNSTSGTAWGVTPENETTARWKMQF